MRGIDMATILGIIKNNVKTQIEMSQVDLFYDLFEGFIYERGITIEKSSASRWFRGKTPIPEKYWDYYHREGREELAGNIKMNIIPNLVDPEQVVEEIRQFIADDINIDVDRKKELLSKEAAPFLADVIITAMEPKSRKKTKGSAIQSKDDISLLMDTNMLPSTQADKMKVLMEAYMFMRMLKTQMVMNGKETVIIQINLKNDLN